MVFEIQLFLLCKEDKNLIKDEINDRYGIEAKYNQIKTMSLEQVECKIDFETQNEVVQLVGKGLQYNKKPLTVWFNYSKHTKERALFENISDSKNEVTMVCSFSNNRTGYFREIFLKIIFEPKEKSSQNNLNETYC
jgi:hypothetical protein